MPKKLLITGIAGFVAHHLCEGVLKNTNWDIVGLDCLTYASSGFDRLRDIEAFDDKRVSVLTVDLTRPISNGIKQEIGEVDYIWHLAAESSVDRSLEDALSFAMSNVVGTTNLLEYVKKYQPKLKKFIMFSTDEVYGSAPEGVYYKEWDTMRPSNPYAASKAGADMMAFSFAHAFGLPIIITRTMNIVGERQHPEKFVPKTVRSILKEEPVILHGSEKGTSKRCWIHAREVCNALLFLTEKGELGEMYHIVGEEREVAELASWIDWVVVEKVPRRKRPFKIEFVDFHSCRPGHDYRYALTGEKLKKMGFKYTVPFRESLEKMVKWSIKEENKHWLNL